MKRRWDRRAHVNEPGGSFDVLLQLTLPVALILAFVVLTELRQYGELRRQALDTPAGVAMSQTEEAILTLQEQLLLKAAREVFENRIKELQLSHYEEIIPTPDQVVDHALPPEFASVTRKLYERFGTQKRRSEMQRSMRELAIAHYRELADVEVKSHPGLGDIWKEKLRRISPLNEPKLDKALAGEMDDLFHRAADPQWNLIKKWILSEGATAASGENIHKAWDEFISAAPADKKSRSDRFVNLKILALQELLNQLNAPLLEEAVDNVL